MKSKIVNVNRMIKRMGAYDKLAKEIRMDIIRSQGTYNPAYSKGEARVFRKLIPTLGDLVMVSNEEKFKTASMQ